MSGPRPEGLSVNTRPHRRFKLYNQALTPPGTGTGLFCSFCNEVAGLADQVAANQLGGLGVGGCVAIALSSATLSSSD